LYQKRSSEKLNKLVYTCTAYMGKNGANIYTNIDPRSVEVILKKDSFSPFVPEWKIGKEELITFPKINILQGEEPAIKIDKQSMEIVGDINRYEKNDAIPYLIQYFFERERAKDGRFTTHAAAVSLNGKAVLLFGKQGSGKTSLALTLCRKYGCKLIGNDQVIIGLDKGRVATYGGTKIFRLRQSTIKYHNQDLRKYFPDSQADEWTQHAVIKPEQIGIKPDYNITIPIEAIYYVHLYDDERKLFMSKPSVSFSKVFLNENLSRYIRGACVIPLYGETLEMINYHKPLDSPNFFNKRRKIIDWLIKQPNYSYISGSESAICNQVLKVLSGK